jgi:hypothetical protein
MTFALTLGLSEPLDCGTSSHGVQVRTLRQFTYDFMTNVVEELLKQSRMLLEILFVITFPLGQAVVVVA